MSNEDRYSPSLQGNLEAWKKIIEITRTYGEEKTADRLASTFSGKQQLELKEQGLDYIISSESDRVKTLEALLKETDVDLDEFNVERYITNKWDQNSVQGGLVELYQVKAWLKRKYLEKPDPKWLENWIDQTFKFEQHYLTYHVNSKTPIVLALADLHTGGYSEGDELIPDYNIEEVRERLDYIAQVVNAYQRPVHVKILGDLIESFTGLNHNDTWKQIEKHGMEVAVIAYDLIYEFLSKLKYFRTLDMIGGNHDRITQSFGGDKQGQVAYLVHEMLKRKIDDLSSRFSPILLNAVHDDVSYILSHGDKRISKSDASELILKYGKQEMYNVLLHAHGHEEQVTKNTRNLRVHQIPPVCPPNQYAVENGYNGASGFVIIEPNKFGRVDIMTKGL